MSKKQIEPIQSWFPNSGDVIINALSLTDFYHYHFDNGGGKVSYSLSGVDVITQSEINYYSDTIDVPSSVIQQWGTDDTVIWDYVMQQLGLVEVAQ